MRRLVDPVVLEISLGVVLTRGTLFSSALGTENPFSIRFDLPLLPNHFSVPRADRHFFQAEVLIPVKVAPCLISFPETAVVSVASSPPCSLDSRKGPCFCSEHIG